MIAKNINLEIFGYENSSFISHKNNRQMFIFAQLVFKDVSVKGVTC